MAYGLKYILRYETERFGTDIRVLIYAKDYTGEATPKKIGAGRIQLSLDRDGQIKGSTLDFSIQADTDMEFASFFTLDNKAHRVELEFNHGVTWTGYIVADQYSEPFIAPPYDVQVMCTDGLGLLKNETFALTGMVSRFEAIRYCIDKIGIALPYAININIWEERMNQSLHNMLDQLYFQAEILSDKTCYEALQSLLPENCFINQANGYWMVERPTDRTLPRYIFNADGTASSETYNWHTFLRQLNTVEYSIINRGSLYPIGNLMLEMQSAWRKFTIKQTYGKKESFFRNYNFKANSAYWSATPSFFSFFSVNKTEITSYAILSNTQSSLINCINQSINVISTSPITLNINYAIAGYVTKYINDNSGNYTISKIKNSIQIQLKLIGTSGKSYFLDQNGWSETLKNIKIKDVEASINLDTLNFQTLNIVASKLPESGIVTISVFQLVPDSFFDINHKFLGLCIENILFYNNDIAHFNNIEETEVILNENATDSNKSVDLLPVDLPDYENNNLYFDNGNYVKVDGEYLPANKWGSTEVRYLEYMSAYMAFLYQSSRSILKGEISGWLELNSYIEHALSNKIYLIDRGTWNVIEHTFNLELIELPAGEFIYDDYIQTLPEPWKPTIDTTDEAGNHVKTIDGSFEVPLPNTSTPVVVARQRTIDPHKMDYDSGTPQFSIQDAAVETNVDDLPNAVHIDAGKIINHHYASLDRTSIRFIKEGAEEYDPTREWIIDATDITLPDDDGYFMYVKVPLAEE